MHEQLESIIAEFAAGTERMHRLAEAVPDERWWERPRADRWSVGECVAHLNLVTVAFRPIVLDALDRGRCLPRVSPGRYSRGWLGGLLWRALGLRALRVKTGAAFLPDTNGRRHAVIDAFDRLQAEQIAWVRAADGLPLAAVRLVSPFDGRVRYNLFACLSILARHQQRHLSQAEQAWKQVSATPMLKF